MDGKFTVRDFLVYLITGAFVPISGYYFKSSKIMELFPVSKESSNVVQVIYLIGCLYIIGHLIQGSDYIIMKIIARLVKWSHRFKLLKFLWPLAAFFLNHRLSARLKKQNITDLDFWQANSTLIKNKVSEKADYWNLMHTLFEGLTLISFCWIIYFIVFFNSLNLMLSIALTIIFWYRSFRMSELFVRTVTQINGVI